MSIAVEIRASRTTPARGLGSVSRAVAAFMPEPVSRAVQRPGSSASSVLRGSRNRSLNAPAVRRREPIVSVRSSALAPTGPLRWSVTRSGAVFSGSGFANGIYFASGSPTNVLVSRVCVGGVLVEGIDLGTGESTFVQACHVRIAGGNGIIAGAVRDCVVRECGTDGVVAISVENCSTLVTGAGTAIKATNAYNAGAIGVVMATAYALALGALRHLSGGLPLCIAAHFFADLTIVAILARWGP